MTNAALLLLENESQRSFEEIGVVILPLEGDI